jgi:hypothetical protein
LNEVFGYPALRSALQGSDEIINGLVLIARQLNLGETQGDAFSCGETRPELDVESGLLILMMSRSRPYV